MMAGYRLRAGLKPKAEGYGGWDSPNGKQLTGHIAGHYLSAASLMFAATGDARVARNGVYKQNTLSIAWTAEAFLRAGKLDLARRCIDELSLYQALWDPPFLPAPSFGVNS